MSTGKRKRELAAKARYWGKHIASWSGSGLSQAEYCRRHGLPAHNLCSWVKKVKARRPVEVSASEAPAALELVEVDFGPVGESSPVPPSLPLRVAIGERSRIEVWGDFEAAVFEKLALTLDRLA